MTEVAATTKHSATEAQKKSFVAKPEKPDQEEYEKKLKAASEEHEKVQQKLKDVKAKLDLTKGPTKDSRQQQLKEQLASVRAAQSAKKGVRTKLEDQIKSLDTAIKAKTKELNESKKRLPYRNVDELDAAVIEMDKKVQSGDLKLAEEKKTIDSMNFLKKQRKNFEQFEQSQKAIDADKKRLDELWQQKKDPEVKELSDKYDALNKELDEIKAEQNSAYKNLQSLRDERSRLHAEQQEKWEVIQKVKDEYFNARNAFRDYEKEARRIKREKREREEKEYQQKKRLEFAAQKMEEASVKAFTSEILTCEGLIGFFDPSSAEAAKKAKLASQPRELAASNLRSVDDSNIKGKKFVREEEDYFAGTGGKKKGKKGRGGAGASPAAEAEAHVPETSGKFNLSLGILEELAKINVETPASREEVPRVLEKLREKLAYYKDNQERITNENIAKAKKEIERLEAESAAGQDQQKSNGTNTPNEEEVAKPKEEAAAESAKEE